MSNLDQRLSRAFDLLLIFLCSLIQTLTLTPAPNNALLVNMIVAIALLPTASLPSTVRLPTCSYSSLPSLSAREVLFWMLFSMTLTQSSAVLITQTTKFKQNFRLQATNTGSSQSVVLSYPVRSSQSVVLSYPVRFSSSLIFIVARFSWYSSK